MKKMTLIFLCLLSVTVIASPVGVINEFQSATPARAAEVNQNFQAVKRAVDDNDQRLSAAEKGLKLNTSEVGLNSDNIDINAAKITQNAKNIVNNQVDESNILHLTGDETVSGSKTFIDPVVFSSDARFYRRVVLPLTSATALNPATVNADFFRAGVPSLRFSLTGEVTFSFPVPDDIAYAIAPQIRLVWGIKGANSVTLDANWQIRNRFAAPDVLFGPFASNNITFTQDLAAPGAVYATDFINLADKISPDDVFGVVRVKLESINPSMDLHLLHVDLRYVSNRLGRPL